MTDTVVAALISGGVGLVIGLVPFIYRVRRDREERDERRKEAARVATIEAERRNAEARQAEDRQRQELAAVAKTYLALLGKVMALLDVLRVDAANADDLLKHASDANAELQGFAQGELLVTFGAESPVVWADIACRRILRKAVDLAHNARAEHRQDERAVATQNEIRSLTAGHIDEGGPRELLRWATDAAVTRWPQPLTSFEEKEWLAGYVASLAEVEPFRPQEVSSSL
jgi:hypothetical protein